jgi:hypothetical protein
MRSVENVAAVPTHGGAARRLAEPPSVGDVHVGDVDAGDLIDAFDPQRQGVLPRGALKMHCAVAPRAQVAEVGSLNRVQIAAAGAEELDGIVERVGVLACALIPCQSVGLVERTYLGVVASVVRTDLPVSHVSGRS